MQARILRLAAKEWGMSIQEAARVFTGSEIFQFIRECFDLFHTEGDLAILEEVTDHLNSKGVEIHDKTD